MIEPGKNKDGYWTNADLVNQLRKVAPLFSRTHPGCKGLFVFDNSQNHHAAPPDGLSTASMNVSDGGKRGNLLMRDGWFIKNGEKIIQKMVDANGVAKGLETILMERGLLQQCPPGSSRCKSKVGFTSILQHEADIINLGLDVNTLAIEDSSTVSEAWANVTGTFTNAAGIVVQQKFVRANGQKKGLKSILMERGLLTKNHITQKEMVGILSQQPDFVEQKEWLSEEVVKTGHLIDYFPKFHCELNCIERVWGYSKRIVRGECDYTIESLRLNVPKAINSIPPDTMKRFFRSSFRYIQAYKDGENLTAAQVIHSVRKYRSHRKVPESLFAGN